MESVAIVAAAAALMICAEMIVPGVPAAKVSGWIPRVALFNLLQVAVVFLGAASWDRWLPHWRWHDAAELPSIVAIGLGYLAITLVFYWWHRARHESPWLWRVLHQVHHSPVRVECAMSFYKHPLEMIINSILCGVVLYPVVGLSPEQAAAVMALIGVAELIYHWNIRTPWWVGFLFQRPEMHRRHHQRDWHRSNYSDLPIWDMLFGTFDNPRDVPQHCGFADSAETRVLDLLLGKLPKSEAADFDQKGDAGR